ncbi:MAG: hypothetical protein ABJM58_04070, partial [Alteripontixanthobacter sp.]
MIGGAGEKPTNSLTLPLALLLGLALSAAAIWLLTGEVLPAAAFAGGLLVLLAGGWLLSRTARPAQAGDLAAP